MVLSRESAKAEPTLKLSEKLERLSHDWQYDGWPTREKWRVMIKQAKALESSPPAAERTALASAADMASFLKAELPQYLGAVALYYHTFIVEAPEQ